MEGNAVTFGLTKLLAILMDPGMLPEAEERCHMDAGSCRAGWLDEGIWHWLPQSDTSQVKRSLRPFLLPSLPYEPLLLSKNALHVPTSGLPRTLSRPWWIWQECFVFLFFPSTALLGYNWHIALCKFKVYGVIIWYMYLLQNDYHSEVR